MLKINITNFEDDSEPAIAVEPVYNHDTGNFEFTHNDVYVEVQISQEQDSVLDAYDQYLEVCKECNDVPTLQGFGMYVAENYD